MQELAETKARREALIEEAAHGLHIAPEYSEWHLSNHLPMSLYALGQLGAAPEAITAFHNRSLEHLRPADPQSGLSISEDNFEAHLGQRRAYLGYYRYFLERATSETPLPDIVRLVPGVSAAAFHALIRVAYGLEAELTGEVAAGLAYLADAYQDDLGPLPASNPNAEGESYRSLYDAVRDRHAAGGFALPALEGVIFQQLQTVAAVEEVRPLLVRAYRSRDLSLETLAACNLDLFLRTGNFTALHTVTATHAARILAGYLPNSRVLLSTLAASSLTALLTIPSAAFGEVYQSDQPPTVEELKSQARGASDDHVVKLVYSCLEEQAYYGTTAYLDAAALYLES